MREITKFLWQKKRKYRFNLTFSDCALYTHCSSTLTTRVLNPKHIEREEMNGFKF